MIFRRFFDRIVEQCQKEGLVWGKELYLDSTQVEANADKDKMLPRFYVDAMNEHLTALFPQSEPEPEPAAPESAPVRLPVDLAPEVEAELAARNAARHDWIAELGRQERDVVNGHYQRQADIWVNTTDPDATMMHKKGGGSAMGYHTHYAVDGGKARIILTALVTPSEVMDNQPMQDLLWHSSVSAGSSSPPLPVAIPKYGTAENIVAMEEGAHTGLHPADRF